MKKFMITFGLLAFFGLGALPVYCQDNALPTLGETAQDAASKPLDDLSPPMKIALVLTLLAVAPAVLMTVTAFTRIIIVLSFVRKALSIHDLPPNQIIIGLALFLTMLTMKPVVGDVWESAAKPYMDETIGLKEAGDRALSRMHVFFRAHAHDEEVALFLSLSELDAPERPEDVPITVMIPAFVMSELKVAFKMGFLIYIPFLVVDIVVASILLALGMYMLPPALISTPFKILLFIMVDGWSLVLRSLMESFQLPV